MFPTPEHSSGAPHLQVARPHPSADAGAGYVHHLRRLLAARDTTQAMQIAVEQVTRSLSCPVAWAGVVDRDYLVMGAHHGVNSAEMAAAWRLRLGDGIGGRVALDRRPQMTRDYQHDSRRVPLLKHLIDNEGIVATLTVPVVVADSTLGVLYAAHRHAHPWTASDQTVVEQIAHDLGVRLWQLGVVGRQQVQVERAERRADLSTRWMESATRLARELAHLDTVESTLEVIASELKTRVELHQTGGEVLRGAGPATPGQIHEVKIGDELSVRLTYPDDPERAFVETCAGIVHLQFLRLVERERTTQRLRGDLLDDLLSGRISEPESFRDRMALLGLDVRPGAQVLMIGARDATDTAVNDRRIGILLRALEHELPGVVGVRRGARLVAIVPGSTSQDRKIPGLRAALSRAEGSWIAGVGRSCAVLSGYANSYDEARAACELGLRGPPRTNDDIVTARELGLLGIASLPPAQLRTTVQEVLGPLLAMDTERGTDFVESLRVYLAHDRHLPATAAALHVHYNTVRNRIAKVEDLLDIDIRDSDDRYRLETALRMQRLCEALGVTVRP